MEVGSRAGFSLDLWVALGSLAGGEVLLDSRAEDGRGLLVSTADAGSIQIQLNDGRQVTSWTSDVGALETGQPQHVVITVDGGPKIITFVVNGVLHDGGNERQFGWGRFSPSLRAPNGAATLKLAKAVQSLRIYNRALRTSEAVGNLRAGLSKVAGRKTLERVKGIEPSPQAWEARILPLNHTRAMIFCSRTTRSAQLNSR